MLLTDGAHVPVYLFFPPFPLSLPSLSTDGVPPAPFLFPTDASRQRGGARTHARPCGGAELTRETAGVGAGLSHAAARSSLGRRRGGARPGVRPSPNREAPASPFLFFLKSDNSSAPASHFFLSYGKPCSSSFSFVSRACIARPMGDDPIRQI